MKFPNRNDDDSTLAEWIEADGRQRLRGRQKVSLQHYLDAVPLLSERPVSLDAAIDIALRSLSGGSRISPDAVGQLVQQHPKFERQIREAAVLNAAIWSTTGLRASVDPAPAKPLPCDFGPALPSGQRRYQLQRLLGQGGFGQVYLALDRQLSEEGHTALVAIKILSMANRSSFVRERLIEEATKVRRISHPNVVMVMDRGVSDQDEDYIVYEYVDGGDLTQSAANMERRPIRESAALMSQIARGVHAAHSAGVIHCDLKPGNIMLTSTGQPKVADFGIAVRLQELSESHSSQSSAAKTWADVSAQGPIGNVAFISPEQYRGEDDAFTVQSDVYAIGGIFYLMLTGELPNGSTMEAIARCHDPTTGRTHPPSAQAIRQGVDHDLDAIVQRAMAVQPSERYSSAVALAEDLERWIRREPIAWTRPGTVKVLRLWASRKPALAAAVVVIVVLAVGGSAIALRLWSVAKQHELDAALAQAKADHEESLRLKSREIAGQFAKSLMTLRDYRISTEALLKIWALEYVYGPKVLGIPEEQQELWKARIINIRHLVDTARAEGRGEELETLLWESALGFWLVSAKDFAEAEPLLAGNIERWNRRLAPTDAWLGDLRIMQTCAAVNRVAAVARERHLTQEERTEADRLDTALTDACRTMPADHHATPMHYLMLNSMIDLCEPVLLNQPERKAAILNVIQLQQARKPVENSCP